MTRNDVIRRHYQKQRENVDLRGTKTHIYRSKDFDESYLKNVAFIEFEPLCQKLWAFVSSNSILNFRKVTKFWEIGLKRKKLQAQNKNLGVENTPSPSAYRVNPIRTGLFPKS